MPKNIINESQNGDQFAAIFRQRTDGDWDFVAMVNLDPHEFPMVSQAQSEQGRAILDDIGECINDEGDNYLIDHFPDPNCPTTYVYPPKEHHE